jgi:putative membrane-bound dehydrogenase-like protein
MILLAVALTAADPAPKSGPFPEPTNSEKTAYGALSPAEAIRQLQLPEGFEGTVFAAEPDVRQPIAITFDARGRLWVAEGYTYADQALNYDLKLRDRILVFEDKDGDGKFDERKVFWEGAQRLTGLEVGFDGVYALALPEMVFLPDRNRDDVPDSEPVIVLDGFDHARARHTMANGLAWGPDGWLYGRQGILGTSLIGKPGTPEAERVSINVGVWRYHPTTHHFEMVTSGTTNPWGMDWNAYGEAFHINTVIGHLWHAIPGAHFRRMFGEDPRPNMYEIIEQHADHVHWDTKEHWSDIRTLGVTSTTSQAGGGHAHTGLMIYQGDNWPEAYRNDVYMINFHGRRLNRDRLVPQGTGYVGKHGQDFAQFGDTWFRGIDLKYGPDGGVYVADWSDTGECHDHDGVHRVSGRIYKITYGKPKRPEVSDVRTTTPDELIGLLKHRNEWFARQARMEIQRRTALKEFDAEQARAQLTKLTNEAGDPVHQVRGLLALHAAGLDTDEILMKSLKHANPFVRVWAIRFLTDASRSRPTDEAAAKFARMAVEEKSAPVRLALASALQQLPVAKRAAIARPLLDHAEDADDHNQPKMIWYGIEQIAAANPGELAELFAGSKMPQVSRWIARRIGQDYESEPSTLDRLLTSVQRQSADRQVEFMQGLADAMIGRRRVRKPDGWDSFVSKIDLAADTPTAELGRTLSAVFGSGVAMESIRSIALDSQRDVSTRRKALKTLIEARSEQLRQDCMTLFAVRDLSATAAEGLATFDDPVLADEILKNLGRVYPQERPQVIAALVVRPGLAMKLLEAVESGAVRRDEISAIMARQIRSHNDAPLTEKLNVVWGILRDTGADRLQAIERWKSSLSSQKLAQADLTKGRNVFRNTCSNCHKLYNEGGISGPDLTGSGRDNLDYLLSNILDPSAQVPSNYRVSDIALKDGRLISGVITSRTPRTISVQTPTEAIVIDADDVEETRQSELSLMPEGLLQNLSEEEVRDLIGYLMKK